MAQIMEFLLNLLLLRGKFLTTSAAETVHEAIRRCLKFQRKIHTEYQTRTQVIAPYEDMMEFVNYNASQFECENCDGKSFVTTSQVHCDLYKYLTKAQIKDLQNLNSEDQKYFHPGARKVNSFSERQYSSSIPKFEDSEREKHNKEKKKVYEDHIIDNLHAILKSQEYLFKNIIKLVSVLEKQDIITKKSERLEKLKQKTTACKDILSNASSSQLFSSIINSIIEDEITRCRFRHGESKTSAEISLKLPQPRGIEIALEPEKRKISSKQMKKCNKTKEKDEESVKDKEVKSNLLKTSNTAKEVAVDRKISNETNTELYVNVPMKMQNKQPIINHQTPAEIKNTLKVIEANQTHFNKIENKPSTSSQIIARQSENTKKLIEANEGYFKKFEHRLWDSLTSMKFLSLRDEYVNMCKCAFVNKRHFATTELVIAKRMREETDREHFQKVIDISNAMFQNLECKLMFETVKEEMLVTDKFPTGLRALPAVEMEKKNPFMELLEQTSSEAKSEEQKFDDPIKQKVEAKNDSTEQKVLKHGTETTSSIKLKDKYVAPIALPKIITAKREDSKNNVQNLPEKTFKNQDSNTVINGNVLLKLSSNFSETSSPRQKLQLNQRNVYTGVKNDKEVVKKNAKKDTMLVESHSDIKIVKENDVKTKDKEEVRLAVQPSNINNDNSVKLLKEDDDKKIYKEEVEFTEKHLNESQEKLKLHSTKTQVLSAHHNIVKEAQVKKTSSEPGITKLSKNVSKSPSLPNFKSKEDISKIPDMPPQSGQKKNMSESSLSQNIKKRKEVREDSSSPRKITKLENTVTSTVKSSQSSQNPVEKDHSNKQLTNETLEKSLSAKMETISSSTHDGKGKPKNISTTVEAFKKEKDVVDQLESQVSINDWKKTLEHISALSEKRVETEDDVENSEESNLDAEIVRRKQSLEMQEKRAMSEMLEKHTGIGSSSSVIEEAGVQAKIKKAVIRKESLEEKVAKLFTLQSVSLLEEKTKNLKTDTNYQTNKRTVSVSTQEVRNEAKRIKVNEKAFTELETTIRKVPVFNDKDSNISARPIKTTLETRRRKVDEPPKKNMSTRHHGCTLKPHFFIHKTPQPPVKTSAGMSNNANDRQELYKEVKKQTKHTLPHDKTFLKNSTWQRCKLRSGQPNDDQKSVHSLAQPFVEVEEKKSNPQMRRTTKNAMKRQQVVTIYPKTTKKNEQKKKSEASLVELGETKAKRAKEKSETKTNDGVSSKPIKICSVNKIVGTRKTFSASLLKEVVHKTLSGNFRCIKWEEQNDEIVSIFKC